MLWIEYKATRTTQISNVLDILRAISRITAPCPICAYDRGCFGLGQIIYDPTHFDAMDDPSTLPSDELAPGGGIEAAPISKDVSEVPFHATRVHDM
jgi:hypothetical protein